MQQAFAINELCVENFVKTDSFERVCNSVDWLFGFREWIASWIIKQLLMKLSGNK
jgi:hypothetical protein